MVTERRVTSLIGISGLFPLALVFAAAIATLESSGGIVVPVSSVDVLYSADFGRFSGMNCSATAGNNSLIVASINKTGTRIEDQLRISRPSTVSRPLMMRSRDDQNERSYKIYNFEGSQVP